MPSPSKNVLKSRINSTYRNYLTLKYYNSGLLKSTPPTQENQEKLEQYQEILKTRLNPKIQKISEITNKQHQANEYIDPLKIISELITSEHFFETQDLIDDILKQYEEVLQTLIEEFRISPLDQLKLNKISFI
jgi:hypothetical protein